MSFWRCPQRATTPRPLDAVQLRFLTQLTGFRSYEGQDMYKGEKVVPIKLYLCVNHTLIKDHFLWDLNNFEGDPEELAKTYFCKDMGIVDPEVGGFGNHYWPKPLQNILKDVKISWHTCNRRNTSGDHILVGCLQRGNERCSLL